MRVDEFDYHLPEELIALRPVSPRDAARLLVVEPGADPPFADRMIAELPSLLSPGDALVFNDTKVIPAELKGTRERDGASAQISVTLTGRLDASRWTALARPAKRLKSGDRIVFGEGEGVCLLGTLAATVQERGAEGEVTLAFDFSDASLDEAIDHLGSMPLPPYIASRRPPDAEDRLDYQTIFAREEGAVAAPTAGLHFTGALMDALRARGVSLHFVTLHVGPGTFLPVRSADTGGHVMHEETGTVSEEAAAALNDVKSEGREDRRRRHHLAAAPGKRHRRQRQARALLRRHQSLHHARLSLPLRRSSGDQLPSAALDLVHAGRGVFGT